MSFTQEIADEVFARNYYPRLPKEAPDAKAATVQANAPEAGSGSEPEDRASAAASDAARQEGEGCDGREEAR